jgi:hypothetical protein
LQLSKKRGEIDEVRLVNKPLNKLFQNKRQKNNNNKTIFNNKFSIIRINIYILYEVFLYSDEKTQLINETEILLFAVEPIT